MSERPETLPPLTPERLSEIKHLLRSESSISFHSHRASESMWMLVAAAERTVRTLIDLDNRLRIFTGQPDNSGPGGDDE